MGHAFQVNHCYEVLFRQSPCPDCPLASVLSDSIPRGITTQWIGLDNIPHSARQQLEAISHEDPFPILETIVDEEIHPASLIKKTLSLVQTCISASRSLFFLKVHTPQHETKLFACEKDHVKESLSKHFDILELPPSTLICLPQEALSENKAFQIFRRLREGMHPHTSVSLIEADLAMLARLQQSGPSLKTLLDLSWLPPVRTKQYTTTKPATPLLQELPPSSSIPNVEAASASIRALVSAGDNGAAQFFAELVRGVSPDPAPDVIRREAALLGEIHDLEFMLRIVGQELLSLHDQQSHTIRSHASFDSYCQSLGLNPDTAITFMQIALAPNHLTTTEHDYENTGKHRKIPPMLLEPLVLTLKASISGSMNENKLRSA